MKQLLTLLCMITLLVACKTETKDESRASETIQEEKKELTPAESIAKAHGIDQWKSVNEIEFTFNVDSEGNHFERSWTWNPKTNDITLVSQQNTINFNRASVDSLSIRADQGFINDKYWLLAPFQLVWDEGTTISESVKATAPISKTELNKITLTYGNDGGYTPGDAYDFFYDDNFMIKEWIFRRGNTEEPSMITTYENYEDFNGIKIAKDHKKTESDWKLYFTNILIR